MHLVMQKALLYAGLKQVQSDQPGLDTANAFQSTSSSDSSDSK
jgi:hypothetical protein